MNHQTTQSSEPSRIGPLDASANLFAASVPLLFAISVFLVIYWENLLGLHRIWTGRVGYSHGYLVVVVCVYLIWQRRQHFRGIETDWRLLPVVALLVALEKGSEFLAIRTLELSIAPAIGFAVVALFLGRRTNHQLWPAAAYLVFALPVWDVFVPILQGMTVLASSWLVSISDMSALITGNTIFVPAGSFEIAEGCSGLRYLVVATALATLLALTSEASLRKKLLLVALLMLLSLIANWVRVFSLISVGYHSDMRHSLIVDGHETFGWLVFLIPFALALLVVSRILPMRVFAPDQLDVSAPSQSRPGQWLAASLACGAMIISIAPFGNSSPVSQEQGVVLEDAETRQAMLRGESLTEVAALTAAAKGLIPSLPRSA